MKAKVTAEFTASNICNREDLIGETNTLEKMVKSLIKDNGLFEIVDDEYKILKVKEIK